MTNKEVKTETWCNLPPPPTYYWGNFSQILLGLIKYYIIYSCKQTTLSCSTYPFGRIQVEISRIRIKPSKNKSGSDFAVNKALYKILEYSLSDPLKGLLGRGQHCNSSNNKVSRELGITHLQRIRIRNRVFF